MNAAILAIILQFAGILVIIAEIILPSGGLLSVIATGLFGYSLYVVFTELSTGAGMAFIVADIIIIPISIIVGLKMLARSPATLRQELSSKEGVTSQSPELAGFVGKHGVAATVLHPAGTAVIEGKRLDVVTRGEYIEKDTAVLVVEATGNRLVVKEVEL
ncbi:MAG: serine protease [Proteobacteria bacterium]|nr:serine protease [Pseudomonadota bacterium]MBU1711137.1 serine protease [Pseudomonadota bacterium]